MRSGKSLYWVIPVLLCLFSITCGKGKTADGEGKVTLRLTHWWTHPGQFEAWQQVIKEFEQEHPNIKVDFAPIPYDMYTRRMLTAAASGTVFGDVVAISGMYAQDLFVRDYTTNLQPFIQRDLNLNDFFSEPLKEYRLGAKDTGDLLALPMVGGAVVLFYNKDLFDATGLPYPDSTWTYDDLVQTAKKLTKDIDGDGKIDQWGLYAGAPGGLTFDTIVHSFGGRVVYEDATFRYSSGLDDPKAIAGFQFYVDLFNKYKVSLLPAIEAGQLSSDVFLTGKIAMQFIASWAEVRVAPARFRWDIEMPPKGPAGRFAYAHSNGFCIPTKSKHKEEAWQLIKWIVTHKGREKEFLEIYYQMPVYKPLAYSDAWLKKNPPINRKVILEMYEKYSFTENSPHRMEWHEGVLVSEVEQAVLGMKSVPEAAQDATRKINAILQQDHGQ